MSSKLKLGLSAVGCVVLLGVGLGLGLGLDWSSDDETLSAANTNKLVDFASTSDRIDCRGRSLQSSGKGSSEGCGDTFAITLRDLCDSSARSGKSGKSRKGPSNPRRSLGAENTLSPTEQVVDRCTCAPTSAPRITVTPRPTIIFELDTLVPTFGSTPGSTPTVSAEVTGPPTLTLQTEAVAFTCPPPDFVGCTSTDPSNPVDECDAEGAPCDAIPGAFCCRDTCRLYCTEKEAPAESVRRRLGTEATTPPEPTYAPTLPPVTPVPTPVPTYTPTICLDTPAPVVNVKPDRSVSPTLSSNSNCPPCPGEISTPRPTPQPVTPFPTTQFPVTPFPTTEFPTIPVPTNVPTFDPTSGSTPTVSTEVTGPPTGPAREPKA